MNGFKEYLIQEYREKAKGFVAVEIKFSHSFTIKTDAKSGVVRRNDLIKVAMKFVDKNLNTLLTASVVFENSLIPKRLHKSFINISPKDLENKFNAAKDEICKEILKEYTEKKNELEDKIKSLKSYWPCQLRYANCNVSVCGAKFPSEIGVIPAEFRGESINIVEQNEHTKKQFFEM